MAKVEIYVSEWCGYCARAKALLQRKGVAFTQYDVDGNGALRAEMSQRAGGRTSVPQVFIDDRHIGGCDDLHDLDARGGLDPLLRA